MLEIPGSRNPFGPPRVPLLSGSGPFLGPSDFNPVSYINTKDTQRYLPQLGRYDYDVRKYDLEDMRRQSQLEGEFKQYEATRQREQDEYHMRSRGHMNNAYDPVAYRPRPADTVTPRPSVDPRSLSPRGATDPRSLSPRPSVNLRSLSPQGAVDLRVISPQQISPRQDYGMDGMILPSASRYIHSNGPLPSSLPLSDRPYSGSSTYADVYSPVTVATCLSPYHDGKEKDREGRSPTHLLKEIEESKARIDEFQRQLLFAHHHENTYASATLEGHNIIQSIYDERVNDSYISDKSSFFAFPSSLFTASTNYVENIKINPSYSNEQHEFSENSFSFLHDDLNLE
jgi:hypothetical protein